MLHPSSFPLSFAPLSSANFSLLVPRPRRSSFRPSLSIHQREAKEGEREREYNGGTFVSRTDLSRCRVEPHYRLPVNSNRVIEEANFSWTGSVFLEIGRGLVNLGPCPPPFSLLLGLLFSRSRESFPRSPAKCDFVLFLIVEGNRPDCKLLGKISFVLLSNRIQLPVCRSYLLIHSLSGTLPSILDLYSHPLDNNRTKERIEETLHTMNQVFFAKFDREINR